MDRIVSLLAVASLSVLLSLATLTNARADEKQAKQILEEVVRAHGGATSLAKLAVSSRTDTGNLYLGGKEVPFVSQVTRSLPDRVRLDMTIDKKINTLIILNSDKAWQREGRSAAAAMGETRRLEFREEAFVWYLATIAPLAQAEFTLDSLPEMMINGELAVGLLVKRKGYADSKMWFTKRNHLLTRIERTATEAGIKVEKEYNYSSHKSFSGLTLPTKESITVNGRKFNDYTISDYKLLEKVDDKTFAKP
jgi:hypothetical protein